LFIKYYRILYYIKILILYGKSRKYNLTRCYRVSPWNDNNMCTAPHLHVLECRLMNDSAVTLRKQHAKRCQAIYVST